MIQRKNVARAGVASIAALTLIFAGTTSSTAAEPDDAEIATERVAMAINAHPLANEAETLPVQAKSGALIAPGRGADVEIPTSFTDPLEVTPAGEWQSALTGLTIELPEAVQGAQPSVADDGSVVGAATDVTGVVQPIDGGLRISTIIESSDAPNSYAYTLSADVQIKLNGDGSASLSRSVEVQDENGIAAGELSAGIGEIGAAWAVDANGKAVETYYEVRGADLIQVVNHNQPGVAYPVVADPTFWWGWNVYVSNTAVGQIVKLLLSGAGTAVLASRLIALIPGIGALAVNVTALAGAILGFGAAMMNQCNLKNRGVYIGHTWVTGVLPFVPAIIRSGYFCVPN